MIEHTIREQDATVADVQVKQKAAIAAAQKEQQEKIDAIKNRK